MREAVAPLHGGVDVEADDVARAAPRVHGAREQPLLQHVGQHAQRHGRRVERGVGRGRERGLAVGALLELEAQIAQGDDGREQPPRRAGLLLGGAQRDEGGQHVAKLARLRRALRRVAQLLGQRQGGTVLRGGGGGGLCGLVAQEAERLRDAERGHGGPLGAVHPGLGGGDEEVEDVEGALAWRVVCDAPLLEEVRDHGAAVEGARVLRGPDLHQLAEAARVAVAHGGGAAKGLEHRVGREHRRRQVGRLVARVVGEVPAASGGDNKRRASLQPCPASGFVGACRVGRCSRRPNLCRVAMA